METDTTKEEILLLTNTTFFLQQLRKRKSPVEVRLSFEKCLEHACRNGMLNEIVQENVQQSKSCERLFIEQLYREECSVYMVMSDLDGIISKQLIEPKASINPLFFLPEQVRN
jgi:hypothetical protein